MSSDTDVEMLNSSLCFQRSSVDSMTMILNQEYMYFLYSGICQLKMLFNWDLILQANKSSNYWSIKLGCYLLCFENNLEVHIWCDQQHNTTKQNWKSLLMYLMTHDDIVMIFWNERNQDSGLNLSALKKNYKASEKRRCSRSPFCKPLFLPFFLSPYHLQFPLSLYMYMYRDWILLTFIAFFWSSSTF